MKKCFIRGTRKILSFCLLCALLISISAGLGLQQNAAAEPGMFTNESGTGPIGQKQVPTTALEDIESPEQPTPEPEDTKAYFILRPSHNGVEEDDATPGPDGKLNCEIYLHHMPDLISGGSFGLRYPATLTGFTFSSPFEIYEPFDTTGQAYHFFHFMEKIEEGKTHVGINAVTEDVLLCTYTFDLPKSDYDMQKITASAVTQLNFQQLSSGLAPEVVDPIWKADEEGTKCYQGVLFDDDLDKPFPIYFKNELPSADGVTVTGKVESYDPKKPTRIELVNTLDSSMVIAGEIPAEPKGKGKQVQEFTIFDVPPGTYSLRITKQSHLSFTKQTVTVGTEPVIITGVTTGEEGDTTEVVKLICGDIDQDGYVKYSDRNTLRASKYYGKAVSSFSVEEQEKARSCDLDGDGYIKVSDQNILMSSESFGKKKVQIP